MKSAEQEIKPQRKQYLPQFKEQALERAKQEGVRKAAKDLGLAPAMAKAVLGSPCPGRCGLSRPP